MVDVAAHLPIIAGVITAIIGAITGAFGGWVMLVRERTKAKLEIEKIEAEAKKRLAELSAEGKIRQSSDSSSWRDAMQNRLDRLYERMEAENKDLRKRVSEQGERISYLEKALIQESRKLAKAEALLAANGIII